VSTDRRKLPSLWQRLRPPAAINYLVFTGSGLLVYGFMMMARGNDLGALLAGVLAIAGVLARWTAAPVLILLLTTYLMIDPGFINLIGQVTGTPWFLPRQASAFNLEDVLLAGGLLAYTIGHFRLTAMVHQGMPNDPTAQRGSDPANPPRRLAELVGPDELPRTLIMGGCCIVVGQLVWVILTFIERAGRPRASQFNVGSSRFILFVWITGLALMLVSAAVVYLRGGRMTRAEASLVLRDEFFQENRRETDRLQRWRKWFKERVALRRRIGK
jgi:hypothetical protein